MVQLKTAIMRFTLRLLRSVPALTLFTLSFATRLYRLDAQSLWLDEGGTWAEITGRTGKGWLVLVGELFSRDAAYPLYHLLLKIWVLFAGDSEWALRFPSALAGALTVVVLYDSARVRDLGNIHVSILGNTWLAGACAALLFTFAPFALWYAQDAKVYSLLMLVSALELWVLLRALAQPSQRNLLLLIGISLVSLFVHRLALLALAGAALAYVLVWPNVDLSTRSMQYTWRGWSIQRVGLALLTLTLAIGGVIGLIMAVRVESRGTGGHIAAGPFDALSLTFTRFSLDRWPGDVQGYLNLPLQIWLLPCLALTLWGMCLLIRDARAGRAEALAILCLFCMPLALLLIALAVMTTPVYEARYATAAFPAWMLVLAYPLQAARKPRAQSSNQKTHRHSLNVQMIFFSVVLVALLLIDGQMLFQPQKGLFSGAAVKEQWREAIRYMAQREHPDDLVIIHPYYVGLMWDYYAPRVTPDPLPQPVIFPVFAGGDCTQSSPNPAQELECIRRTYNEPFFNEHAYGKKRALLLIAPDHARLVDPPPTPEDSFGWVGLQFQYANEQRTWPCGGSGDQFIGVTVMCQSYPSTYNAGGRGKIPQPVVKLEALFGGELHLRGYSIDLFGGAARPGGSLPITLYWDAAAQPTHNYQMFLHLCRDCDLPPLASDDDSPPLEGYAPAGQTTTWRLHDPVHDERTIRLPADLPPGRYTLLLGVYPPDNPSTNARLTVASSAPILGGTRLVLGAVTITK